jgi:hypothetical protein
LDIFTYQTYINKRFTDLIICQAVNWEALKSILDADLSDNKTRQLVAQALRRVVTRIDLSLNRDEKTLGLAIRTMVSGVAHMIDDPCPVSAQQNRSCRDGRD